MRDQKTLFRHQKKLISKDLKNSLGINKKPILIALLLKMKNQRINKNFIGIKKLFHSVLGKALSQGQVQTSWHARHFRKVGAMLSQVRCRFRGRRSAFARCGTDFAAGAARSQGQVQISWQAQYFRKVRYRLRSRRRTFARCGPDFAAGAALSQNVPISRQAQHFRKVRCSKRRQFRGSRSTFARYGAEFDAGAALNQRGSRPHDVRGSEDSTRGAVSSVNILQLSRGVGGGGSPPCSRK